MDIIKQGYVIKRLSGTALEDIEEAARNCYKSEGKIGPGSAEKLISKLVKSGHFPMIEFADMTVEFTTSRNIAYELIRHRLCSYAQESTRYVGYLEGVQFIEPYNWESLSPKLMQIWADNCIHSEATYHLLINEGMPKEEARDHLVPCIKTCIFVKANFTQWRHIFKVRCDKAAHPQMRDLMIPLFEEMNNKYPMIFNKEWT